MPEGEKWQLFFPLTVCLGPKFPSLIRFYVISNKCIHIHFDSAIECARRGSRNSLYSETVDVRSSHSEDSASLATVFDTQNYRIFPKLFFIASLPSSGHPQPKKKVKSKTKTPHFFVRFFFHISNFFGCTPIELRLPH